MRSSAGADNPVGLERKSVPNGSASRTSALLEASIIAALGPADALAQLDSRDSGLSQAEAQARLTQFGRNELGRPQYPALRILGRQFKSALVYVLIVAGILAFVIRDLPDGVIIVLILLINTLLGFVQEYRSERAIEELSKLITRRALVKRNGTPTLVDVAELVPGDIVMLEEGDIVPADVRLLAADYLQLDESLLTGESAAVGKDVAANTDLAAGDTGTGQATSLLYAGSTITRGKATAVVYATGQRTELGKIAALSSGIRRVTQYEQSLQAFSTLLLRFIVLTLGLLFIAKVILTGNLSAIPALLLFVMALAIAVVPEALPVVTTVTLSRGALALAREHVVVKRLSALEDVGNVTLLCTDKTGTLTENCLSILTLESADDALCQKLAWAATEMGQEAASQTRKGAPSAYDAAFEAYIPAAIKHEASSALRRLADVPFDPEARRRRVLLEDTLTKRRYLVVIGAPEILLALSDCPDVAHYHEEIAAGGAQGLRHLGLAYKALPPDGPAGMRAADLLTEEQHLTFLGLATLADPLKASTAQTVALARELGVAIKILTGDSQAVATYVAQQIGLVDAQHRVYMGAEIEALSDEALAQVAQECNVFARVTPAQKYRIIAALQKDYVVGYQGDGINDAPALKLADVGIAVDTAADVAKANADLILLRKDLHVIVNAIKYGREIFVNINKYIKYTMVGNFGNYFALAALFLLSYDLPLLARQLLLLSLLTDLPLITIASDTVSPDEVVRPVKHNLHALMLISLLLGSLTALFELVFFASVRLHASVYTETSLYLFLTLTQLIVIFSIRSPVHFWRTQPPSRLLAGALALTAVVAVLLPYLPPAAAIFSFTPLSVAELAQIAVLVLLYLFALDQVKLWYYQLIGKTTTHAPAAPVRSVDGSLPVTRVETAPLLELPQP